MGPDEYASAVPVIPRRDTATSGGFRYRAMLDAIGPSEQATAYRLLVRYFAEVVTTYPVQDRGVAVMVTHLLPERPVFVSAVAATADLGSLIPKPRSIDPLTLARTSTAVPVHQLSRRQCADPDTLTRHLEATAAGRDVVLLDIGGYFATALPEAVERYSGRIVGVVEDTENGFQRYQAAGRPPRPVFSVARSPLKEAEDYLVGQSVVFSIEALLRSRGDILQGRPALVIGFGKIGRSVAGFLRGRGVRVSIYDTSAMKRAEALAHGYGVHATLAGALAGALLIVGATGNRSIPGGALASIRPGAYLATVTSSDDELDMPGLATYQRDEVAPDVIRYRQGKGRYFFLLNDGQAVNFTHGAVVGPFIHLVQAEILVALCELQQHAPAAGFHEIDTRHREHLAQLWLRAFGAPSTTPDHLRGAAT